ncbi:ferric-rhodotorulic acid/ferric-coprogen receptor FhuE [Sulfurospirillum barnesii]|uniref:TonB-dependent siderophore receptor n=1 Tax=Sulfurospirillum barnesii (strain ATCC 700032 / DSM 10660 / SES-3) TaxID=760154 RepID=I3XZB0_SULBS|nr:ferric-rhodotorulic acid/ferric-coprogen receptor FhuE [Sulfurospirillum barnesii]AFL69284.1 TonB-dependent siderophore receptor [Sulfurospirillum barnesii SES-3]
MTLAQKALATVSLALVFNTSLLAQAYTIQNKTLKEALEIIASQSKLSYAGDSALLDSKKANNISNIEGLEKALEQLLKGTGLEAVVKDNTIIIIESNDVSMLNAIAISASQDATTEGTSSYTTKSTHTATRMNLSIKETPQSVVVVTQQQIEDQKLETITDAIKNITGVSTKTFDSERQSYAARGFDITNYQIDGVPTTWEAGWSGGETSQDLAMYDRVEVIRGANGLISGAGNPSAAINMVRKHATSNEFKGSIEGDVGRWDRYGTTVDMQSPVNEDKTIRARVVGKYQESDSFIDFYENKRNLLYGVVDVDVTDDTLFSAGFSYQENEPTASMWGGLPSWYSDGSKTNLSRSSTTAPKWSAWESEAQTYFSSLEHYFANNIKLYGAYSHSKNTADAKLFYMFGQLDKTTGLGLSGSAGWYDVTREQDNVDIYTSIPFELGGLAHELVAGMMYNEQTLTSYARAGSGLAAIGNFYAWDGSYAEPTWGNSILATKGKTKQLGGYTAGKLSLTDHLKLIAGTRISNWETDVYSYGTTYSYEHTNVMTPYAGVVYDLDANHAVYASYTEIFQPQNYRNKSGGYLDPIEGKNYETGIKGEYFDGKLNATLSVFRIEQDNVAQPDGINMVPGSSDQAYYGASGTVSKGYEIDVNGEISEGWRVSLGWSQFEAKDADGVNVNTTHPRKIAKIYSTYTLGKFTLGGGVNWESETYTAATNPVTGVSEKISQSAYTLVNLMGRYKESKDLTFQVNVNNLFDKKYYSNVGFYNQVSYGEPLNVIASVKYSF